MQKRKHEGLFFLTEGLSVSRIILIPFQRILFVLKWIIAN
jgi:hypothetical protein